jgi:hypothetical protein
MIHPDTAWLLFLTSLSGGSASTPRVRLWRALKGLGVAILRDGVAVLPASAAHRAALEVIGAQVEADGGDLLALELPTQGHLVEDQLRFLRPLRRLPGAAGRPGLCARAPRLTRPAPAGAAVRA